MSGDLRRAALHSFKRSLLLRAERFYLDAGRCWPPMLLAVKAALYHSTTHIYRDFFFFPAATAGRRAQQHRQAAQIK